MHSYKLSRTTRIARGFLYTTGEKTLMAAFLCRDSMIGRAFLHRKNAGFSPFVKQNGIVNIRSKWSGGGAPFFILLLA